MQNAELSYCLRQLFQKLRFAQTIILHSAFLILHLIRAIIFKALGNLDDSGSAQAVSAQGDELFSVFQAGNTAGGLDLHMGGNMLGKEFHVGKGCAGLGESGGSLDIVCAGVGHTLAERNLLLIRQQAGLDDAILQKTRRRIMSCDIFKLKGASRLRVTVI